MIYLDNAATSWPKPYPVAAAMRRALAELGANPGRGGYRMSQATAEAVCAVRSSAAALLGLEEPERVVFTANCTAALNTAINCFVPEGSHIVISDREHNSVVRPLHSRQAAGRGDYSVAQIGSEVKNAADAFAAALRPDTSMIICTHRSNVEGKTLPIAEIGRLAAAKGLLLCVDAAQSAGSVPIDMRAMGINLLALPGHKGLCGPTGTGMLLARGCEPLTTLIQGGTGSMSAGSDMPAFLPDALEAGTLNTVGIIGLGAGIDYVAGLGVKSVGEHESKLREELLHRLERINGVKVCGGEESGNILLFNIEGVNGEQAAALAAGQDICLRAGLHCAPSAHKLLGTLATGAVRASFGIFNDFSQVHRCADAIAKIAGGRA